KKMRPDIVSVATHTDTHVPLTELCMRSGVRAIMCEKPLAEKSKEGEVLLRLQKKYPKSLIFVNHMRRFDPLLKNAAQKVREGFIGEVLQATAYYTKGIRNNGTHAIDLLRYFCGDVAWVYAIPAVDTFHRPGDTNIDAILKFKSGTTVALQLLGNRDYDIFDLHLYGRKGALTITREGFELLWGRVMPSRDYQGFNELQRLPKVGEKRTFFAPMAEHIVRCLDGAERPVSTVADGVAALRVIEALLKSAQTSQKIIL
ncbi:MAG: Gfo/Idh/MocA family oxidoreductase, partial [bacterium]|nr:Gfo/Idh/MocA family oxidoreductase [bacterium]